jgi:hypothetical protein
VRVYEAAAANGGILCTASPNPDCGYYIGILRNTVLVENISNLVFLKSLVKSEPFEEVWNVIGVVMAVLQSVGHCVC